MVGSQVQCQSLCGLQHAKPQLSLTSDPPDRTKYHGYLVDKSARSYSPLSRSSHLRLGQWSRDSQQSHPLPALSAGLRQIQVKSAYATAIVQVKTAAHTQDTFCGRHRHADNLQLSQRRAEAVRAFLVETGTSPTIMSTKGFGRSDPRVPGDSEQARAANRRVEIGIVDSKLITIGPLVVPK